jgi:hypothetical protein
MRLRFHAILSVLPILLSFFPTSVTHASTLYVSKSGHGSTGDSWGAAFNAVSEALAVSTTGDEVWVAGGVYNETVELVAGVALFGGFAGTESPAEFANRNWEANVTILDGYGLGQSVVRGASGAVLDGFTVTKGVAERGGGVYCEGVAMEIANCTIRENTAMAISTGCPNYYATATAKGGGVFCRDSTLEITDCQIANNTSFALAKASVDTAIHPFWHACATTNALGAGVYCENATASLHNCRLTGNAVQSIADSGRAGHSYATGGALHGAASNIHLAGCFVHSNTTTAVLKHAHEYDDTTKISCGAGIAVEDNSQAVLGNCLIASNNTFGTTDSLSYYYVYRNAGGAIYSDSSSQVRLSFCTVWGNNSSNADAPNDAIHCKETVLTVSSSIIWNGSPGLTIEVSVASDITYCDIEGGYPGTGNIDLDPQFEDAAGLDFRLMANSSCIDSASTNGPDAALDGNLRPIDIPGLGRDQTGDEYDMGAYEASLTGNTSWTPTPTPTLTHTQTLTYTPTVTLTPTITSTPAFAHRYVAHDATGANDGSSWEDAHTTICSALVQSVSGDLIWVKGGDYPEYLRLVDGVDLCGGFAGTEGVGEFDLRDWEQHPTSIVPNEAAGESIVIGADDVVFDGFQITRANNFPARGLSCSGVSMKVSNCRFEKCGITYPYRVKEMEGAGIYATSSTLEVRNCILKKNEIYAVKNGRGAGISCRSSSVVTLDGCEIDACNTILSPTGCYEVTLHPGAGLSVWEGSLVQMRNCIVARNVVAVYGNDYGSFECDDVRVDGSWCGIEHCTFKSRTNDWVWGSIFVPLVFTNSSEVSMRNSIVWEGEKGIYADASTRGSVTVTFCDVEGGCLGQGNIDEDPAFIDAGIGDFRLQANSPCIDTGTDAGLVEDLDGNPRPIDIPGVGADGTGTEFDMGAYEFPLSGNPTWTPTFTRTPRPTQTPTPTLTRRPTRTPTPSLMFDLNRDRHVDPKDLFEMLRDGLAQQPENGIPRLFRFACYWKTTDDR